MLLRKEWMDSYSLEIKFENILLYLVVNVYNLV